MIKKFAETLKNWSKIKKNPIKRDLFFIVVIIIIITSIIAIREYRMPFFWNQDDNADYFLPIFVHNFNSIKNLEFPLYNFHQSLGYDTFAEGQSNALNPLAYLAVIICKIFLPNYNGVMDVYVAINLILSAIIFYFFLKTFRFSRYVCFFGAVSYSLNGFNFYLSNSWQLISTYAVFFNLLLLVNARYLTSDFRKYLLFSVPIRAFLVYAGSPQYFAYCILFELIYILGVYLFVEKYRLQRDIRYFHIKKYFLSAFLSIPLTLPMILPLVDSTFESAYRSSSFELEYYLEMGALTFKSFIFWITYPALFNNTQFFVNGIYIGVVGLILFIFLCNKFIKNFKKTVITKSWRKRSFLFFFSMTLITIEWSMGGFICRILYFVPLFNRFRFPFKLLFYSSIFIIIAICFYLPSFSHALKKYFNIEKVRTKSVVITLVIIQILSYLSLYSGNYNYSRNYMKMNCPYEIELQNQLKDGRVVAIDYSYSDPLKGLLFNFPTLYGFYGFGGYCPLISKDNYKATLGLNYSSIYYSDRSSIKYQGIFQQIKDIKFNCDIESGKIPIEYFIQLGVKYFVTMPNQKNNAVYKDMDIIFEDASVVIFSTNNAKPFVFFENSITNKISDYTINTNSVIAKIENTSKESVIFNFLYNKNFRAFANGNEIPIEKTKLYQMKISVDAGKNEIKLVYYNKLFIIGVIIALSFLTIFLLFIAFYRTRKGAN